MTWEYKIELVSDFRSFPDMEKRLNDLGSQGWELVTVVSQHRSDVLYLKRRKPQ